MVALHLGDCLEALKGLPDNSVDAIVTDPPYGLSFMGKKWDYDVPSVDVWAECLRVLKPGGHLLAFAGTRTQHRMAVRIEDAGFEIRDMIAWVYGSGFPKSLDVSKAIDKAAGAEREVLGRATKARSTSGASALPTMGGETVYQSWDITAPATDAARQWQGWGTALKPALEPITVARKPMGGTVAANVLEHGTGALNIDACRVPAGGEQPKGSGARESWRAMEGRTDLQPHDGNVTPEAGRWPANIIHDGSDEVLAQFPETKSGGYPPEGGQRSQVATYGKPTARGEQKFTSSEGSAARFFYCAKASKRDRDEGLGGFGKGTADDGRNTPIDNPYLRGKTERANTHPTVKPTDLMRYLCRLVTPPGGVVLDPFMGSGSTGKAAVQEGFRFIGVEKDPDYLRIAKARIDFVTGEDLC